MKRLLYRDGWSPLLLAFDVLLTVVAIVTANGWLVAVALLAAAGQLYTASPAGQRKRIQRPNHKTPEDF